MPVTPTYPGVYIEEVPSGVRTIVGVATSITAFIGRALRGPLDDPVRVQSYAEYQRIFGGLWAESTMSYAVQHYFLNGGRDALIVRVADGSAAAATAALASGSDTLTLEAANPGTWGNNLQAIVDYNTKDETSPVLFNLTIQEVEDDVVSAVETFRNLSVVSTDPRYVETVLEQASDLVRVLGPVPGARPDESSTDPNGDYVPEDFTGGDDGGAIDFDQIAYPDLEEDRKGLWALQDADLFNLLCIPPFDRETDVDKDTWTAALAYCKERRAMLIVDSPSDWYKPSDATTGVDSLGLRDENAALYFPRLKMADPLQENRLEEFAACGAVAGIVARTDAQRGVWKAPAGQDATLLGVRGLSYKMTDWENGVLNPLGVNCLRTFPVVGHVVWGARTLEGADRLASEWKYLPVRRLALFLEESLYRGTQWVVFEPNDEPLWAQIRLNVGAFMHNLFRQGAFQGTSPRDAYFVKCDGETTTQNDINQGIVNILVGFAPLKPAEFVIIKISQIAGEIQT
jgi:phage tail sheath protein FI